jgi:hypothetical protein
VSGTVFQILSFRSALKVTVFHLNAKYRPLFKSSRLSMHLGVPLKYLPLLEPPLFSLNPIAMPPSLKDLEARMDAMDGQRNRMNSIRARARLATCARAQLTRQRTHQVQINNGDFYYLLEILLVKKTNRLERACNLHWIIS